MQSYTLIPFTEEQAQMAHQITIKASEGHRKFGQLLKRVYGSDEHLIVERDGFPVAVLMSYQEYEQLSQTQGEVRAPENLPPPLSLAEAFGSVTPINQPEDFAALREAAIEDHVQQTMAKEKE
jgi:prevent-host-death family protein